MATGTDLADVHQLSNELRMLAERTATALELMAQRILNLESREAYLVSLNTQLNTDLGKASSAIESQRVWPRGLGNGA